MRQHSLRHGTDFLEDPTDSPGVLLFVAQKKDFIQNLAKQHLNLALELNRHNMDCQYLH